MLNGLETILKNTAKFKESRNKLEQSFNSLMDGGNNGMLNSVSSFMSSDEKECIPKESFID